MCGIVGYCGFRKAEEVIISSLKRLEYRGYDSWGLAVRDGNELKIFRSVGNIGSADFTGHFSGNMGIGHTRWATHGKPSEKNAHPHTDCTGKLAVVHNGIISNFQTLKEELSDRGHVFRSDTDTEVIAHLIEENYSGDLKTAVIRAIKRLNGSYAIVAIHSEGESLVACRYKSPLILGVGDEELIIASDVPALLDYTNRVVYLDDGDVIELKKDGYSIWNGKETTRSVESIPWSIEDAEKGGYEHFMLKEIHEAPGVIENNLAEYVPRDIELDVSFAEEVDAITVVACGTSYHAGLVGRYVFENLAQIPVRVEYASEFVYGSFLQRNSLVMGITQSGETADTLEAMKRAKKMGSKVLAITNVLGSSATRVADYVIYSRAGPEISVAATKSFIAQLVVLYLIAIELSSIPLSEKRKLIDELKMLPGTVQSIFQYESEIASLSEWISEYENMMYVGRGYGYPVALEGALKMKEISYIHAEGYPAGELKHGPFALLGERTPVIAILIPDDSYSIMLSNIKEMKARDSPVIALADENDTEVEKYVDRVIRIPSTRSILAPITYSIVLQLLAYYTAKARGCEIDRPRNLAKSVTVE